MQTQKQVKHQSKHIVFIMVYICKQFKQVRRVSSPN